MSRRVERGSGHPLRGGWPWRSAGGLFGTQFVCNEGADGFQDFCKQFRVASDQVSIFQEIMSACEITGEAARFLNQQYTGSHIPYVQTDFPEAVKTPAGYIGEVESG